MILQALFFLALSCHLPTPHSIQGVGWGEEGRSLEVSNPQRLHPVLSQEVDVGIVAIVF